METNPVVFDATTTVAVQLLGPGGRKTVRVRFPSDDEWAQKKTDFLKGMAEQKKNAMIQAFLSDRRRSAKVEIRPEALK